MRRPSALGALLAGLLGATLVAGPLTAPATAAPRVPDPTTSTLRQLAAHTGMRVGTAVDTSALRRRRDLPGRGRRGVRHASPPRT